jgi:O-methyltransferase
LVECGVWNGGSAALMAVACCQDPTWYRRRTLWLFDSFQGLPPPGEHDGACAASSFTDGWCKGSIDQVTKIFAKLGVPLQNVRIVPGWFETTIPAAEVAEIAVLHIDADWYSSVKLVLDRFYDRVVSGGFIVLDDYGHWPGCRDAVHDYLDEHGIAGVRIIEIDQDGAYFQAP